MHLEFERPVWVLVKSIRSHFGSMSKMSRACKKAREPEGSAGATGSTTLRERPASAEGHADTDAGATGIDCAHKRPGAAKDTAGETDAGVWMQHRRCLFVSQVEGPRVHLTPTPRSA